MLRSGGYEVRFPRQTALLTEDDVLEALAGFSAVIAGSEPYTDRVLSQLGQLRLISRNGVGYDAIDVPSATRRGIAVTITPEGNHQAVAEHALALLLAVARSIVPGANDTRAGNWRRRTIFIPLRGKTLGIVGFGRIGRSVAVRAAAFGLRIVACEKYPDAGFVAKYGIELVDFDTLLAQSDFVTLHAPMTAETRHLINRAAFARMKPGSVLVNTARGAMVDETALLEALQSRPSGRRGAGRAGRRTAGGRSSAVEARQRDRHATRFGARQPGGGRHVGRRGAEYRRHVRRSLADGLRGEPGRARGVEGGSCPARRESRFRWLQWVYWQFAWGC